MRCLFINLDTATERRERITAAFDRSAPPGWRLERIEACRGEGVPGRASMGAKGCFLSHRKAVEAALSEPGDVLILEDDAAFSRRGFEALANVLRAGGAWDLLMTDLAVLKPAELVTFALKRERYEADGSLFVGDLAETLFAGSSAYVVRDAAKAKLLALLDGPIDLPYDFALRALIHARRISGGFCIPFLTTLSVDAEASQIHPDLTTTHATLNAFRRLMFIERDLSACAVELERLRSRVAPAARLYGDLFAGVVSGD